MMKLFLSLILILIAFPLYANPCMQIVMGGSSGTAAPPAVCETQSTPNDMETSDYTYTTIASSASDDYMGSKFVAGAATGTICRICLNLNKVSGTEGPTMNFSVQIWSNACTTCDRSDDKPNAMLSNYGSMNAANIAGTFGDCFSLGSVVTVENSLYWIVVIADAYNATDYFRWVRDATCATEDIKRSGDGSTWYLVLDPASKCNMVKLYTVAP